MPYSAVIGQPSFIWNGTVGNPHIVGIGAELVIFTEGDTSGSGDLDCIGAFLEAAMPPGTWLDRLHMNMAWNMGAIGGELNLRLMTNGSTLPFLSYTALGNTNSTLISEEYRRDIHLRSEDGTIHAVYDFNFTSDPGGFFTFEFQGWMQVVPPHPFN